MEEVIRPSSGKPLTSDSDFHLSTAQHKQLVEALWAAARKSFPLIVLTGPEGVGKSVLLRHLKTTAPPDVAVLDISSECIVQSGQPAIAAAVKFPTAAPSGAADFGSFESLIDKNERFGRHLLLILDDAEEATESMLAVLSDLFELVSKRASPPTVLLVGSPQFEVLLAGARFSAFTRRRGVIFRFHPMTAEETSAYIRRRLQIAGLDPETFDQSAVEAIHRAAIGLPKEVDVLCSNALAAMLHEGRKTVDIAQLDQVVVLTQEKLPSDGVKEFDVNQSKLEYLTVEGLSQNEVSFLPVVEPSEFVFLSRDRPETSGSACVSRSGPIARARQQNETELIRQSADSQPLAYNEAPRNGGGTADFVKAAPPSGIGGRGQANKCLSEPRRRFLFASSMRPASAFLVGVAALALIGLAIITMPGGERSDGSIRRVGGEPDQIGEAEISALGTAPGVGLSAAAGRMPTNSGLNDGAEADGTSSQVGVPADDRVASELWEGAGGSLDTAEPLFDELEAVPPDQVGAQQFFRHGLEVATQDRRAAILAFSRAAIRGHVRSAYYLGQIYETGDGVPADIALARAWYALAADHPRARQKATELAERGTSPEQDGETPTSAPPQLAFAERSSVGILDLVWIGSRGGDSATGYIVELAAELDGPPVLRAFTEVSALRFAYPDSDELWWRVTPMGHTAASNWQLVSHTD